MYRLESKISLSVSFGVFNFVALRLSKYSRNLIPSLALLVYLLAFLSPLLAEEPQNSKLKLFNFSARRQAELKHKASRGNFGDEEEGKFRGSQVNMETVQDILDDSKSQNFFKQYRGPFYLSYVYEVVPAKEFVDWESKSMAEKVLIYQAANSVSRVLVNSALEPLYRQAVDSLRWFQDYTSIKLQRKDDGGLRVQDSAVDEKPLLEFKLHVSTNKGIEPRLEIGEHCTLRYDVIDQDALVEFKSDF